MIHKPVLNAKIKPPEFKNPKAKENPTAKAPTPLNINAERRSIFFGLQSQQAQLLSPLTLEQETEATINSIVEYHKKLKSNANTKTEKESIRNLLTFPLELNNRVTTKSIVDYYIKLPPNEKTKKKRYHIAFALYQLQTNRIIKGRTDLNSNIVTELTVLDSMLNQENSKQAQSFILSCLGRTLDFADKFKETRLSSKNICKILTTLNSMANQEKEQHFTSCIRKLLVHIWRLSKEPAEIDTLIASETLPFLVTLVNQEYFTHIPKTIPLAIERMTETASQLKTFTSIGGCNALVAMAEQADTPETRESIAIIFKRIADSNDGIQPVLEQSLSTLIFMSKQKNTLLGIYNFTRLLTNILEENHQNSLLLIKDKVSEALFSMADQTLPGQLNNYFLDGLSKIYDFDALLKLIQEATKDTFSSSRKTELIASILEKFLLSSLNTDLIFKLEGERFIDAILLMAAQKTNTDIGNEIILSLIYLLANNGKGSLLNKKGTIKICKQITVTDRFKPTKSQILSTLKGQRFS